VGVRADESVRVIKLPVRDVSGEDAFGQIFKVDLMNDSDARGDDLESVEGVHAPLQELITLPVAFELDFQVALQGLARAVEVHLYGVVHDEINGNQRLNEPWISAEPGNGRAHGGQIHQQGNARKVLQHDARDHEWDFLGPFGCGLPVCQRFNIFFAHPFPVAIPQNRFQHQPDRDGQL